MIQKGAKKANLLILLKKNHSEEKSLCLYQIHIKIHQKKILVTHN